MSAQQDSISTQNARKSIWLTIGAALWVSFLSAGVATTLFFSAFDPAALSEIATFPVKLERSAGYSIGFLLFWALLFINSVAVAMLSKQPLAR
jgi:hypothetical protein